MALTDYTVPRDKFKVDPYAAGNMPFPCADCVHRGSGDRCEPCRTCDHNAWAVPEDTAPKGGTE